MFLNSGCIQLPPEITAKIKISFEALSKESNNTDEYTEAVQKNILYDIILTAIRYGKKKNREKSEGADKIQEAARYISENYASDITLHSAASLAYMEDTYFSKQFKKLTGFGFNEYLIHTRIKAAEDLLILSDMTVSEISDYCGFSSSNYFGDVFKRLKGVSPSQFRKFKKF